MINEYVAGIYGTGGMDKLASQEDPPSMEKLAFAIAQEACAKHEVDDLEKVAEAADQVLSILADFDMAGRAVAHNQFGMLEKLAFEGDPEPLETFFGLNEEPDLRDRVYAEIARRRG